MLDHEIIELPLCECGCGLPVAQPGNRFIRGHARRKKGKHRSLTLLPAVERGREAKVLPQVKDLEKLIGAAGIAINALADIEAELAGTVVPCLFCAYARRKLREALACFEPGRRKNKRKKLRPIKRLK